MIEPVWIVVRTQIKEPSGMKLAKRLVAAISKLEQVSRSYGPTSIKVYDVHPELPLGGEYIAN